MDKPLTQQTPVEIDTQLAEIYNEFADVAAKLVREEQYLAFNREELKKFDFARTRQDIVKSESAIAGYKARLDSLRNRREPLEVEFTRRGGWTRAFLVNNSNGHVHRDMHCSTCFLSTQYIWLTEYSGGTEAQVVEDAGERACTVCYPSAPVETRNRPTKIFTPDEKAAQAERERRAAKKAADADKLIFDAEGKHPLDHNDYPLRTKIAARNEFSSLIKSRFSYDYDHPQDAEWERVIQTLKPLLVEAGFDTTKIETAALKKAAKEKAEGEAYARQMGWIQ